MPDRCPDPKRLTLSGHTCRPVAVAGPFDSGRACWLGELLEPIPDYPTETHCLHVETPLKGEIVFGLKAADFEILAVLIYCALGYHCNSTWIERRAESFRHHAADVAGEGTL